MKSILFLDFDGALSPGNTGTLRHAPDLARLLEPYPHVELVLTTNWRARESLSDLADYLRPALGRRVYDKTPILPGGEDRGGRQMEIEHWLAENPTKAWLAIDDTASLFRPDCPWLFLTDSKHALDSAAQVLLSLRLREVFGNS